MINHGHGCGLIDPHGDLADNLLKLLTRATRKRRQSYLQIDRRMLIMLPGLVYIEPGRNDYFTPMNVLSDNYDSLHSGNQCNRGIPKDVERGAQSCTAIQEHGPSCALTS